jgi:ssDNA-specific exonuclease RecJ
MYPYLLNTFNFNFGSSSLRLIGALGLKHQVIIKLKKVFNLLLLLEIEALQ